MEIYGEQNSANIHENDDECVEIPEEDDATDKRYDSEFLWRKIHP